MSVTHISVPLMIVVENPKTCVVGQDLEHIFQVGCLLYGEQRPLS